LRKNARRLPGQTISAALPGGLHLRPVAVVDALPETATPFPQLITSNSQSQYSGCAGGSPDLGCVAGLG
jgi:hypothetical protein